MNKSPKVGKATKPRTVYEKAVQDFTETAQQLARLNQHFRQASFAEFEMLMGLDDEVLKRYGLPKLTVKRALIKAYETVVLDQQRWRLLQDHDGFDEQIFGVDEQIPGRGQTYLSDMSLKVIWVKQITSTFSHHRRVKSWWSWS
jgi:hypothetical protein